MTDSPSQQRSRRLVLILTTVVVVAVVVAALVGTRILGIWGDEPEPEATASPSPETVSPFAGTPAEDFPEGADGIVLPPAEPVGDFTADQVANALEQVRAALIEARLDESMLVDHDPTDFLAALAPDLRPAQEDLFDSAAFAEFATQIADDARLWPLPPRVTGAVSYDAEVAERDLAVIEVTTRFVWVYAFEATAGEQRGDLVVVRDELVWLFRQGYPWSEASQGLWLADEIAEDTTQVWGADCDAYEEGLLRPDPEPPAGLMDRADVIFDPEQPLDGAGGC